MRKAPNISMHTLDLHLRHQKIDALNINLLKVFLLEQALAIESKGTSYAYAQRCQSYGDRLLCIILVLRLIKHLHLFCRFKEFDLELRNGKNELHLGQLRWILDGRLDGVQRLLRVFDGLPENQGSGRRRKRLLLVILQDPFQPHIPNDIVQPIPRDISTLSFKTFSIQVFFRRRVLELVETALGDGSSLWSILLEILGNVIVINVLVHTLYSDEKVRRTVYRHISSLDVGLKSESQTELISEIPELIVERHLVEGPLFILPTSLAEACGRLAFLVCSKRVRILFELPL